MRGRGTSSEILAATRQILGEIDPDMVACSAKTSSAVRLLDAGAIGVTTKLYQNLYHRPPALASAHERRIAENPLIPAPTSARLIFEKREVGSSNLSRPTDGN